MCHGGGVRRSRAEHCCRRCGGAVGAAPGSGWAVAAAPRRRVAPALPAGLGRAMRRSRLAAHGRHARDARRGGHVRNVLARSRGALGPLKSGPHVCATVSNRPSGGRCRRRPRGGPACLTRPAGCRPRLQSALLSATALRCHGAGQLLCQNAVSDRAAGDKPSHGRLASRGNTRMRGYRFGVHAHPGAGSEGSRVFGQHGRPPLSALRRRRAPRAPWRAGRYGLRRGRSRKPLRDMAVSWHLHIQAGRFCARTGPLQRRARPGPRRP